MKPNNKTVLFVFSLSASIEAERKPIFGAHKKSVSREFFKLLNQKTLNIAKKSNVDVVWLDETQQIGNSFGERYLNAYKSLFDQGYEKVISIGNDTPNLTAQHIKKAIYSLSNQDMVFGPSKDGGVYLLGYTKSAFDEESFNNFSWLTSNLSNEIEIVAIEKGISFNTLEILSDIDSKNNALEYAYTYSNSYISSYILFHFKLEKANYKNLFIDKLSQTSLHLFLLRGPPSL